MSYRTETGTGLAGRTFVVEATALGNITCMTAPYDSSPGGLDRVSRPVVDVRAASGTTSARG